MYRTLFTLAGFAIVGWLPLILLPGWRWSRRLAESGVFPLYLSVLYFVGIAGVLAETGPGIMADFGNVDGVLALLRTESLGLVAWIHILAFDQVVGLLVYRDNMRHRFVPLPAQSVILFLTLMFGPVGFLGYAVARAFRSGSLTWAEPGSGDAAPRAGGERAPAPGTKFADLAEGDSVVRTIGALLRRERAIVACALLAFALAAVCAGVAAARGSWSVPPEGRLLDAFKFEVGVGIYFVTLAVLLPLADMSALGRRRWVGWTAAIAVYFVLIETVQAVRGLDPRFTRHGGTIDQVAGTLFGVTAIATIILFAIVARRFFRDDVLSDHRPLRTAIRYGIAAIVFAFGTGIAMSVLSTRIVAGTGSLMPLHAAGFHGLQAVPLIALFAGWSSLSPVVRTRLTHVAGIGWLLMCTGLLLQAMAGQTLTTPSPAGVLAGAGLALWASCLGVAAAAHMRVRRLTPGPVLGRSPH